MNTANFDLVVTGQVQCGNEWKRQDVQISQGKISIITGPSEAVPATQRLDVGDSYILPGMVDAHVHSLSHPGEGLEASTRSAAAGGVTTIVEIQSDLTGAINTPDRLKTKRKLVEREAFVDVAMMRTRARTAYICLVRSSRLATREGRIRYSLPLEAVIRRNRIETRAPSI